MVSLPVEPSFSLFSPFYSDTAVPEWAVRVYVVYLPNILNDLFFFSSSSASSFFFSFFGGRKQPAVEFHVGLKKISLSKQSRKLETLLGILKRALEKYTSRFKKANNFTYAKECLTN